MFLLMMTNYSGDPGLQVIDLWRTQRSNFENHYLHNLLGLIYMWEPAVHQMCLEISGISTSVELAESRCVKRIHHIREIWLGQTTTNTKTIPSLKQFQDVIKATSTHPYVLSNIENS